MCASFFLNYAPRKWQYKSINAQTFGVTMRIPWLLRHLMTNFSLRRMAPYFFVVIIKYTAIGTVYCKCMYFCLNYPSYKMHLHFSFMQSTAKNTELSYALVKIIRRANQYLLCTILCSWSMVSMALLHIS